MRLKGFTLVSEALPRTRLGKLKRYQIRGLLAKTETRKEKREEDTERMSTFKEMPLRAPLQQALAAKEEDLRAAIAERVREQGGRLVGWALGATIARRALAAVQKVGDALGKKGQIEQSISQYRAALQLKPDYADAHKCNHERGIPGYCIDAFG